MDHLLSQLVPQVYYDCFKDLNFMDDKLTTKTAKFTFLKNLYAYGILLNKRNQIKQSTENVTSRKMVRSSLRRIKADQQGLTVATI